MQQKNEVFEYAVVRLMPRVEREEFINVGVILYCARLKFLKCRLAIDEERIHHFAPQLDLQEIKHHLQSFVHICDGDKEGGPIALLDIGSRFRWLTAVRSTMIQASKVHPGLCSNGDEMLERVFVQMIGKGG